jgi:hypothetical protein
MIWVKDGQLENISCRFEFSDTWNFPQEMVFSCLQEENIPPIDLTFEVSKIERSREVREEQLENIQPIYSTFAV